MQQAGCEKQQDVQLLCPVTQVSTSCVSDSQLSQLEAIAAMTNSTAAGFMRSVLSREHPKNCMHFCGYFAGLSWPAAAVPSQYLPWANFRGLCESPFSKLRTTRRGNITSHGPYFASQLCLAQASYSPAAVYCFVLLPSSWRAEGQASLILRRQLGPCYFFTDKTSTRVIS